MRDDFPDSTKRTLASRVANVCSNPDCRAVTSGPQDDPDGVLNVGVAAHITGASAGGPRFDASLSSEQRCAVNNGIWLCQNCAKLVDNDPSQFPASLLLAWKTIAENRARRAIGQTANREGQDTEPVRRNANASAANNLTQNFQFSGLSPVPPVAPPPRLIEENLRVIVELTPWEGPSDKMYLTVTNMGSEAQSFQGQCRILARRNDPNAPQLITFDLQWEYGGMAYTLQPGQSGNLLIASADHDGQHEWEWLQLEPARGIQKPARSDWKRGDNLPEYDVEIIIIGSKASAPYRERFTVRAGTTCAIEMEKYAPARVYTHRDPRKEAEALSDDIRKFLKELGPRPQRKPSSKQNSEDEEHEAIREHSAALLPWAQRLQAGWLGRFEDRVKKTRHLLVEHGVTDIDLDMALMSPTLDEARLLRIADRLLVLSRA